MRAVVLFAGIIGAVIIGIGWINWGVHRLQTRGFSKTWGYGSLRQFWEQFAKFEWERGAWRDSYFSRETDSEIHAGIIRFRGHGMVLYPWSYPGFRLWLRRERQKTAARKYQPWQ